MTTIHPLLPDTRAKEPGRLVEANGAPVGTETLSERRGAARANSEAVGRRRFPSEALTAAFVRGVKEPGAYADGHGLALIVDANLNKRWILRLMVRGKRREMGLGSADLVSLVEAREEALQHRKTARLGGDPIAQRRAERIIVPTFEALAREVHESCKASWKNGKHVDQWINTLEAYVFPTIGTSPVNAVERADVLKCLSPIWTEKPETARRVRQRTHFVFDWAIAHGYRRTANPVDGIKSGLPRQPDRGGHHTALPYAEMPAFIAKLHACDIGEGARLAFELLILTVVRTSELLGMRWPEVDFGNALWTIPAERMKANRDHRVPLGTRALELLRQARRLTNGELVFPGRRGDDKPLSNMVFLMALRRMKVDATAHGFRSSFRDWAADCTEYPNEVCELALAHVIKDKTESAYRRGDMLERRRELMKLWEAFVTSEALGPVSNKV